MGCISHNRSSPSLSLDRLYILPAETGRCARILVLPSRTGFHSLASCYSLARYGLRLRVRQVGLQAAAFGMVITLLFYFIMIWMTVGRRWIVDWMINVSGSKWGLWVSRDANTASLVVK